MLSSEWLMVIRFFCRAVSVQFSRTMFVVDGTISVHSLEDAPYRQMIHESQVYIALASYILTSGIVAGQIRSCSECGRLFLLKLKSAHNREVHCSTKCYNRATDESGCIRL